MGKDFGLLGNADCKSKCPSTCGKKTWQYWKGKIGSSKGTWDYDYGLNVKGSNFK